jgi:hypothetical protein
MAIHRGRGPSPSCLLHPGPYPRYFDSVECRREARTFAQKAKDLGVSELIMPLLYVDVPALHEESPSDDLAVLMKEFQWEDWTELRFEERPSKAYRTGVNRLVQRLVQANAEADRTASTATAPAPSLVRPIATPGDSPPDEDEGDDDQPGSLDLIAGAERAMPLWTGIIERIGRETEALGEAFERGSQAIATADARGAGAAGRLRVAREVAHELAPIAERFTSLANDYVSQMYEVDAGTKALIEAAVEQSTAGNADPADVRSVCNFFESIRNFQQNVGEGLGAARGMAAGFEPMERSSRDLRKPLRELRRALTMLNEAERVAAEWVAMIDASSIECPEP